MNPIISIGVAAAIFVSAVTTSQGSPLPNGLCRFENSLVPCVRLRKPAKAPLGQEFEYLPIKWIPLWPTFAIFGGLKPLKEGDFRILHEDRETEPYDPVKPNIENTTPTEPAFDESFVDDELAYYSTWVDREIRPALALIPVDRVFHGQKVFDYWERAIESGITCATKPDPLFPEEKHRYCVFVRQKPLTRSLRQIEYCSYEVFGKIEIRSSTTCTTVASETRKNRSVFSARYTSTSFLGGASAGEYTCFLPSVPLERVKESVEVYIKSIIGKSSKYFSGNDEHGDIYKAEGINVPDQKEKFFLRIYIFGKFGGETRGQPKANMFSMNVNVTVSAQASDNIIDYREPNEAMINRLRNRFEAQLKDRVRSISVDGKCRSDIPW